MKVNFKTNIKFKTRKDGKKSIYLDYYHSGTRQREVIKDLFIIPGEPEHNAEVLDYAKKMLLKRLTNSSKTIQGDLADIESSLTVYEFCKNEIEKHQSIKQTYLTYTAMLNRLNQSSIRNVKIKKLTESHCNRFLKELYTPVKSKEPVNSTIKFYFNLFKTLINQAVKKKLLAFNPCRDITLKRTDTPKRDYLTLSEVKTLAVTDCSKKAVKNAFLFACLTGLRISDIRALTYQSIKNGSIEITQTKTKQSLYIPLNDIAKELINPDNVLNLTGFIFRLPSQPAMRQILIKWFKDAGINKRAYFHISRHTFATLTLTAGADLYTVSKLLGHTDIKTTQIYAKIVDEAKKEAVNKLNQLFS